MFKLFVSSLLIVRSVANQEFWDQTGPGWKLCSGASLYYGKFEDVPTNRVGYGEQGANEDDHYVLTFEPPVECQASGDNWGCLYLRGQTYKITLSNTNGSPFGGFAVMPVIPSPVEDEIATGNFFSPSTGAQVLTYKCGPDGNPGGGFGIGHTDGATLRTSVSANWTGPTDPVQFTIIKLVKDSADLTSGKWYSQKYYMYGERRSCTSTQLWSCDSPAIVNTNGHCALLSQCKATDFGNETANCCKLPTTTASPEPEPEPEPSGSGSGSESKTPSSEAADSSGASQVTLSGAIGFMLLLAIFA